MARRPKLPVKIEKQPAEPPVRRKRQQNIKVSEDCAVVFAALADAEGLSKASLFEDMVAERLEQARRQGIDLGLPEQ